MCMDSVCVCVYIHWLCPLRGLSNEIPIRMCILNTQILVFKHNFQLIGSMNLWKKCLPQGRGKQSTR